MFDVENIRAMHEASHDKCLWIAFSERSDEMVDMLSEHFFGRDSFPWDGKMKECLEAIHEIGHNVKVTYKTVPETEVMSLETVSSTHLDVYKRQVMIHIFHCRPPPIS